MVQEASVTGVFKTILIIIGALVALRFIGKLMIAKRNIDEERNLLERERKLQQERNEKLQNFGKVTINSKTSGNTEDIDFEEVN